MKFSSYLKENIIHYHYKDKFMKDIYVRNEVTSRKFSYVKWSLKLSDLREN
jgi:hypothetical protein